MTATAGNRSKTVFLQELAQKNHSSYQTFTDIVFPGATALIFRRVHDCHHCRGNGGMISEQAARQIAA